MLNLFMSKLYPIMSLYRCETEDVSIIIFSWYDAWKTIHVVTKQSTLPNITVYIVEDKLESPRT